MEQKDHLLSFQIIAKIKIRANPRKSVVRFHPDA